MELRRPIFTALDGQLVASGLMPDVQDARAALWVRGDGVEFVSGQVRNRKTDRKLFQLEPVTVRGIVPQRLSNGEVAVWVAYGNNLWRWDQFSADLKKTYEPGALDKTYFDFTPYGDWLFINRGFGKIDWWNGAGFSNLPEMPSNVAMLMKHLSFLLALGTGSKQTGVSWSDANDISKWVSTPDNSAGSLFIDEFEAGIVAGEQLGPVIAVYSENQMAVVSFIGAPFYFGFKVMQTGIGAIGPECVVAVGSRNYGVSRQGIWETDGESYRYIDEGALNKYLQDRVNWAAAHKIIAARNDILRTVEFHFPMGNSYEINEGWSYDPATNGWSKIQHASFYNQELALGLPLRARENGEVLLVNVADRTSNPLHLQTRPMLMQLQTASGLSDAHFATVVESVELFLKEAQNCQMRIGSSMEHNGPIHWSPPIPISIDKSTYPVPAGVVRGVYWHLEFTSTTTYTPITEDGVQLTENGEVVLGLDPMDYWKFNLQGFLLYGNVSGSK